MGLITKRSTFLTCFFICLLVFGILTPFAPAQKGQAQENEDAVKTETDNGVLYTYADLKEYKNCVEIIKIEIIKESSTLKIPEKLNAKKAYTADPYHYTETPPQYIAVVTVTNWEKVRYYSTMSVLHLKAKAKSMSLRPQKKKGISVTPDTGGGFMKNWKVKSDILKFTSSNPKVAKVTSKGIVKALKRGKAVITVRMKTNSAKCKVKVTVR